MKLINDNNKNENRKPVPGLAGGGALMIGNDATRISGAFKSSLPSILFDDPPLFSFK